MKKISIVMIIWILFVLSGCIKELSVAFIDEVDDVFTIEYDGLKRRYYVYIPSGVEEDSPMLFMLHGYGVKIEYFINKTDLKALADKDKVILVYPEGTEALGLNHWNANLDYGDVDDVGFLTMLKEKLVEEYNANPQQVFLGGYSNGGFMAYTLACEENQAFLAYMSVSGTMSGDTWETCDVENATNIFHFHGEDDLIVPIDGSMSTQFGWGGAPRIETMLNVWIEVLKEPSETSENLSDDIVKTRYVSSSGHQVVYIKANNYGHPWADDGDLFDDQDQFSDMSLLLWEYMISFVKNH